MRACPHTLSLSWHGIEYTISRFQSERLTTVLSASLNSNNFGAKERPKNYSKLKKELTLSSLYAASLYLNSTQTF